MRDQKVILKIMNLNTNFALKLLVFQMLKR